MGYYIETDDIHNKADWLIKHCEGVVSPHFVDSSTGMVSVVVVNNGPFEAAAIAYDQAEFDAFNRPDDWRPKTCLAIPVKYALQHCPSVSRQLKIH